MKSFEFATIGEYFRQKRVDANLTQRDLAEEFGFSSPQMVSNWERGLCAPPFEAIAQMIPLLKIPKDEFVSLLLVEHKKYLDKKFSVSKRVRRAA